MEEKKPDEVLSDDTEQFDALERTFHKVMQSLVGDHALDKFRAEYEKLHAALATSHEHNAVLVEQCRTLNNEILANATKVSSVLQISQNDQRSIAGLRHEFEKAWKLVELSQEHEDKSREVIEA
jgi:succinate dehydrogenase/fumarate reductase flavoprotein subunit